MKLDDKVAIVVGAGSGIGKATAKLLAREGAKVVAADRDLESVKKTVETITNNGHIAKAIVCDMTKESEAFKMVQTVLEQYGQVDILVNVAGGSVGKYIRDKMKPFAESSKEEWDTILDVNLNGARNCTRGVISNMISRHSGKIVNFSSMAGVNGSPNAVDYSAAKAAVIGFTKALAQEMAPFGIRVNCVAPSGVFTERLQAFVEAARKENPKTPPMDTSKMATPEEIAEVVLFLVSDDVPHISGHTIIVDSAGYH